MANKSIRLSRDMIKKLMATEPLSSYALLKVTGANVKKIFSGIHAITKTPIKQNIPKKGAFSMKSHEFSTMVDLMSLQHTFKSQLMESMKSQDKLRTSVLRGIISEITYTEKSRAPTKALSNTDIMAVLQKMVNKRKESIDQFRAGNRPDLVACEEAELNILTSFLPEAWSEHRIEEAMKEILKKQPIDLTTFIKNNDMGKILSALYEGDHPKRLDLLVAPRKIVVDIIKRWTATAIHGDL